MAERRMFAKTIIDSDAFLDMPLSAQALYFHLSMRADDDGFINNPKKIQRMICASTDDLNLLSVKGFIIPFETGIVVIKHWKIHNVIQKDRYKETIYTEEKSRLAVTENKMYTEMETVCIQDVSSMETQDRIGKDSIGNNNIYTPKKQTFSDEIQQIVDYLNAKCNTNYRTTTEKTRKLIITRLKEKFTVDDFKIVIDKKSAEWLSNAEMVKFLRPETLFGTKFENYLNQQVAQPKLAPNEMARKTDPWAI